MPITRKSLILSGSSIGLTRVSWTSRENLACLKPDLHKRRNEKRIRELTNELIQKAQIRTDPSKEKDELLLQIWDAILEYADTDTLNYEMEGHNNRHHPPISKITMARLHGWCKLIGLKPHFVNTGGHDYYIESNSGRRAARNWIYYWELRVYRQGLPDPTLKAKLIQEYGKPPRYD